MAFSRAARSGATRRPACAPSPPTHRGPTRSGSPPRRKETAMATTAPDTTQAASPGWLDSFLTDWRPGSGEPRETFEPATGRPLLTLPQATVEDVAGAAKAAAAAQPGWAETSYDQRAAIMRRAAEIYEAHRPEVGT